MAEVPVMKYVAPSRLKKKVNKPIKCLGMSFENEAARRSYFLTQLAHKLQQQDFKNIPGFPNATDEEILALSNPPYYTACPNPWLSDFLEQSVVTDTNYQREAFVADVTESKNDPIYNAHSYHTKLPYKAITRYILHYTEPGDLVFDGFCGTGMTGVAAQLCADKQTVETLTNCKNVKVGARRAILNDLSPAATFLAYNYNTPTNILTFDKQAKTIIQKIKAEYGWMYQTRHSNILGDINYVVWSDVFICPNCSSEIVFWNVALDQQLGKLKSKFPCPDCDAELTKRHLDRALVTSFDAAIGKTIKQSKQIPVLINYSVANKRYQKIPDKYDLELLEKIENMQIPYWFPIIELPEGYNTNQAKSSHGISHVHHFYTKRNLHNLAYFNSILEDRIEFILTGILNRSSKMNRIHLKNFFFGGGGWNAGYLKGTLYIPSLSIETSITQQIETRLKSIKTAFQSLNSLPHSNIISTGCSSTIAIKNDCIDYIFLDPPFGSNLMYSELNLIWEAWLKVFTNNKTEAIINNKQNKDLEHYSRLMKACFQEAFRILKPGRWMTVVFSNTQITVWQSLKTNIEDAGFIIADIAALDKNVIISAYKANEQNSQQLEFIISDEASAIKWLKKFLNQQTSSYQQIQPKFIKSIANCKPHEYLPELKQLLELNFIKSETDHWHIPNPQQAQELEKRREKHLLREFRQYQQQKRLKKIRTEALLVGFKQAWKQKDYQTIINIAEKLPEMLLYRNEQLLQFYELAKVSPP